MTVKVNGASDNGEFLVGNIDFFTLITVVPCVNTLVSKPISELKKELRLATATDISTVGGITIHNIVYANDLAYNTAYDAQANLDMLVRLVETRAQPIMLNAVNLGAQGDVTDSVSSLNGHTNNFGTSYAGLAGTVYSVKFAIEHEGALGDQAFFANELNNTAIRNVTAVIIGTNEFNTSDATALNTVILKNEFV